MLRASFAETVGWTPNVVLLYVPIEVFGVVVVLIAHNFSRLGCRSQLAFLIFLEGCHLTRARVQRLFSILTCIM